MPIRRRRTRYRRRGGNQPPGGPPIDMPDQPIQYRRPNMSLLTRAKAFVKRHKLISRGLNAVGAKSLADRVSRAGYGKRRRHRRGGCCKCR